MVERFYFLFTYPLGYSLLNRLIIGEQDHKVRPFSILALMTDSVRKHKIAIRTSVHVQVLVKLNLGLQYPYKKKIAKKGQVN